MSFSTDFRRSRARQSPSPASHHRSPSGHHRSPSNHTTHQVQTPEQSASAYLAYPVAHVVSGLYRRLTEPAIPHAQPPSSIMDVDTPTPPNGLSSVYTPPHRTASPFQPPPLTPLHLHGYLSTTPASAQILSRHLAEEIRLLVPPRLQLVPDWTLAYSIEQDGTSLGTLYKNLAEYTDRHHGFVLVVRDAVGSTFGAFLTDPPRPQSSYFGTGECFLWRASVVSPTAGLWAGLPPPPSADTTHAVRSTTLASPTSKRFPKDALFAASQNHSSSSINVNGNGYGGANSGYSTPERIRFKAFPYSGVNDFMIYCQNDFLSVGGGDGKYGLWLDRVLERGISSHCLTFGNEGLSEEGEKFEVLGVEMWYIGT